MVLKLKAKGKWQKITADSMNQFADFISMEELTDYELIDTNKPISKKTKNGAKEKTGETGDASEREKKRKKNNKKKKKKSHLNEERPDGTENQSDICVASDSCEATGSLDMMENHISKVIGKRKSASESSAEPATKKQKLDEREMTSKEKSNTKTVEKKKKNKNKSKTKTNIKITQGLQQVNEDQTVAMSNTAVQPVEDMSKWNGLFVPDLVLKNLSELGFSSPTIVQEHCLPAAIKGKMDIIAAAETGSGKTLAFGIPIIDLILRRREDDQARREKLSEETSEGGKEESEDGEDNEEDMETCSNSDDEIRDNNSDDDNDDEGDDDDSNEDNETEGNKVDEEDERNSNFQEELADDTDQLLVTADDDHPLYALVLTPTRELAYQIRDHLRAISKNTGIKCHVVVGGMSIQKQSRLLDQHPEIVVATPGRLWDIYKRGNRHLQKLSYIRCLVIDEADRMVEKFHFEHLSFILREVNQKQSSKEFRQTFILSATLTYVPPKPQRLKHTKKKKNFHDMSTKEKLESLSNQIGIRGKPKIVDLTPKQRTASKLTETRLNFNAVEEKDLHMYCFLKEYSGRTIVFANSVDCVTRLMSLFTLLEMSPLRLFADMQQKQRLKSLEKFKENPRGLLLATDVAARGLDIAGIEHVIHYEVPKTTESYIHRSGRTARANSEGFSILFVGPKEVSSYRKIMKTLDRDDLPVFPVNDDLIWAAKERVTLARKIELDEFNAKKRQRNRIEQLAKEAELGESENKFSSLTKKQRNRLMQLARDEGIEDLEDFENKSLEKWQCQKLDEIARRAGIVLKGKTCGDDEDDDEYSAAAERRGLVWSKKELKRILSQPLVLRSAQTSYPTRSGKMLWPYLAGSSQHDAIETSKKKSTVPFKKGKIKRK